MQPPSPPRRTARPPHAHTPSRIGLARPPRPDALARRLRLALAASVLALALAPLANAGHVDPTPVSGPGNHTCDDFAPEGTEWLELKVDPPEDGVYVQGNMTVLLDVDDDTKTFDWESSLPVDAVFVKAGRTGHNLYEYDPAATGDEDLTSPGAGTSNQISHISFCYEERDIDVCELQPLLCVPTCEEAPEMPECQPTCEEAPEMPECQPTCEGYATVQECCADHPELEECPPTCEEVPESCEPTCEQDPTQPVCQPQCGPETTPCCPAATLTAIANGDGSIVVTAAAAGNFSLLRSEAGGTPVPLGDFVDATVYIDTNTTVGVTYAYFVVVDAELCAQEEVTSIPDFPVALGSLGAAALGTIGYAMMRRRK